MRTQHLLVVLLFLGLVAGCPTGVTGIYPTPVWLPEFTGVAGAGVELPSGSEATFTATWEKGAEPFAVSWTFSGGTVVENISATAEGRTNSVSVLLANTGTQTQTYTGVVQIVDARGNSESTTFTFMVQPAN